jgi:hypothetical protein
LSDSGDGVVVPQQASASAHRSPDRKDDDADAGPPAPCRSASAPRAPASAAARLPPTPAALAHLTKLDSFLKASQRINAMLSLSFLRKVDGARDVALHDGTMLPRGAYAGVANCVLARDAKATAAAAAAKAAGH